MSRRRGPAIRRLALGPTLIAAATALLAACAGGEPDIRLDQPEIDLGQVTNGQVRSLEVGLLNEGKGNLVIEAVSTSCGCTSARVDPTTLGPGQQGVLSVSFDSGAHGPQERGPVMRQVFIASNDPDQPELEFRFTAEILPPPP